MNTNQSVLQFAVICSDLILASWQIKCIKSLLKLNNTKLLLVLVDRFTVANGETEYERSKNSLSRFEHKIFKIYKQNFLKPKAFHHADLKELFPDVSVKEYDFNNFDSSFNKFFNEVNNDGIRRYQFDFILDFGTKNLSNNFLKIPHFGVWRFSIGNLSIFDEKSTCFWEIFRRNPITKAILFRLTTKPEQVFLLRTGFFKTLFYSPSKNLDQIYFECANWPASICKKILHTSNWDVNQSISKFQTKRFDVPTNIQTLKFFIKIIWNKFRKNTRNLFESEDWNVGVVEQPIHSFLDPKLSKKISWLPKANKNTFYADPFAIKKDNDNYLFFEEFDYKTHSKWISYLKLNGQINISSIRDPGLIRNTSYPYLIDYEGEIYCIPEAWHTKEVALFKALEFPRKWEKACVLIENVSAVDSTIFRYSGLWWLAGTIREEDPNLKLFLWYADTLFGPYHPHLSNPVKIDIRSSRPAGTPFIHEKKLYRPAQDCSRTYGGGIVINVIKKLTPTEFQEEVAAVIKSDANTPYTDGIHTIAAAGDITIIDGKRHIFNINALKHVLRKRFIKQNG